jgi:DNA polymerase phi
MGSKNKRKAQDTPAAAPAAKKQQSEKPAKSEKKAVSPAPETTEEPAAPVVHPPFYDEPKGPHLKREVLLYDQLSSEDANERLNAADAVVSGLLGEEGVSVQCLQRHLERRLFRGLASGRKGARLGFSIVLTEVLGQILGENKREKYGELTFDKVLNILVQKTKPDGDLSGQEEKDHALGLLFGLQCFVRAKVLFLEDNSEHRWEKVFAALMLLAEKKPWLREEIGWVIVESLVQMSQTQAETTLEKLVAAGLASTSEGVGIWLTARKRFPDMRFPSKPWGSSGNPLEHLKTLAKALKESSDPQDEKKMKEKGNWNPALHFVWGLVVDTYIAGAMAGQEDVAREFEKFWKVAVDENLFAASASRERKFWGFSLFQKMVNDTPNYPELLTSIFSPNLVRCLINHLSHEDRFLHRAAEKSLRTLQGMLEAHPHTIPVVLPMLISGQGFYNFDQVTKTKTVDKMLGWVSGDDAEETIAILLHAAMRVDGDKETQAKDAEVRRQFFADYLLSMIRRVNMSDESKDASWLQSTALPTLAKLSYSKKHVKAKPELSEKSRGIFRTRLTSAFAHLISDPKGFSYPCTLLQTLKPDAVEMEEDLAEAKDTAVATMEKLLKKAKKAKDEADKAALDSLALLYALVVFQLLNGEADAAGVLEELGLCYDKLVSKKKKAAEDDEEGDEEADASQVLVEILMSLISKPSLLLRKVAQHVFTAFAPQITSEGLALMTDVLSASESQKGQQELFDQNGSEDEEEGSDNDNEDELDSDVEMIELGSDVEVASGDDSDEDEDADSEAEEADDKPSAEADALENALAAALGTHKLDPAAEESDSDADMSDSEMLELDKKLVEIFKQRKSQKSGNSAKKEKKDARETVVNFKNRVLELLEIYVKKHGHDERGLAYGVLMPVLGCMRTTGAKQVADRCLAVVVALAKSVKSPPSLSKGTKVEAEDEAATLNPSALLELLTEIHTEEAGADLNASHAFSKAASTASLLVAGVIYKRDQELLGEIAQVYMESQVRWVRGEGKFQASFFHDWVNWCQSHVA